LKYKPIGVDDNGVKPTHLTRLHKMSISLKKRPNYLLSDFVKCVGLTPISQPSGVVHSPFEKKEDIPIERCASAGWRVN